MGYSFRLTARVLLYAPSHRQDNTYHSRGALAGKRNSSMNPLHEGLIRRPIAPWANTLTTELLLFWRLVCFKNFSIYLVSSQNWFHFGRVQVESFTWRQRVLLLFQPRESLFHRGVEVFTLQLYLLAALALFSGSRGQLFDLWPQCCQSGSDGSSVLFGSLLADLFSSVFSDKQTLFEILDFLQDRLMKKAMKYVTDFLK